MTLLTKEIEANFVAFTQQWKQELSDTMGHLAISEPKFSASYRRMVSLNAWREFLSAQVSKETLQFFVEAQNDILISHVLASMGCWRSALNSLRSCIENVGHCLYYKDHPVELELWMMAKHRIDFRGLCDYFARHPFLEKSTTAVSGLTLIRNEFSILSRAVHGSISFRMTGGTGSTSLWNADVRSLGPWITRQSKTLTGLNLFLLAMFRDQIQGTKQPGLRAAASLAIPASKYDAIKKDIQVALSG
jgi:hypothetical protein